MGNVAAESIFTAVKEGGQLSSIDDLKIRAKIGNSTIDSLEKFGYLKGIPKSNQVSFFDLM